MKVKNTLILLVAAVMIVAMCFAGAASAVAANGQDDEINVLTAKVVATPEQGVMLDLVDETGNGFGEAASADAIEISTLAQLKNLMKNGGEGKLVENITIGTGTSSQVMSDVTLDLNGKKLILGAETSSKVLDATITVNKDVQFNLINSKGTSKGTTGGKGGFYNNGHLIANGAVDVSTIQWNVYPVPNTSFTSPDCGGIVYGLQGTLAIGAEGSLKLAESHDKSPNLIMAANDKMLSSSDAGAKFIIVTKGNDKTYVAAKDGKDLVWVEEGREPALKVTGICADPYMGSLRGTPYSEFAENIKMAAAIVAKMKDDGSTTIKLMEDLTMDGALAIGDYFPSLTLDLNGHILSAKDVTAKAPLLVMKDCQLNITDSDPTAEHIFVFVPKGPWKLVENPAREQRNSAVSLDEFNITDALSAKDYYVNVPGGMLYHGEGGIAGGILCQGEATVNMSAGSIVGGLGQSGAVMVHEKGRFNMLGGTIAGCYGELATVDVTDGSQQRFSMSGDSRIVGCGGPGGIIYIPLGNGEILEMAGNAVITECYGADTGAVNLVSGVQFNVSGNVKVINNIPGDKTGVQANVFFNGDNSILKLTGPFTGLIGILVNPGQKFGIAAEGATGAENFVIDNSIESFGQILVGKIEGDKAPYDLVSIPGCIVTFDPNNGAKSWIKPVEVDTKVTKPENPTKKGYNFLGWYNGDKKWDFKTNVTEDLTLTAKWEIPYTPSHKESGYTQILQEGQVAPTQVPTATPTPTAKPTVQPIENPTVKPTTQPTQKSPAPFAGLVLGLGAAALFLRLRK